MNSQKKLDKEIAFIGSGNMAISILSGLVEQGYERSKLRISDPDADQRSRAEEFGVDLFEDNNECVHGAEIILICVKPQIVKKVCQALTSTSEQLVISIAAGITTKALSDWLPREQSIIRCMPNTPALIRQGITGLYANEYSTPEQKENTEQLLGSVGTTLWVTEENKLDVITAISGSGPAYFFYLMEQMVIAGIELGITENEALELTLQTALGASRLASREQQDTPTLLREKVTSPGGTTQSALQTFKDHGMDEAFRLGIKNAFLRSKEISQEFGN